MPPKLTEYELERQKNIEENKALLKQLGIADAPSLGFKPLVDSNAQKKRASTSTAKPVQPRKRKSSPIQDDEGPALRRQSTRLRRSTTVIPLNETPAERKAREKAEREREAIEAKEREEAAERAAKAKLPRHQDLDLETLLESDAEDEERGQLSIQLSGMCKDKHSRPVGDARDWENKEIINAKKELKEEFEKMEVVSRAKVTQDRVYSMAYHPEKTKDLIFFGDKHGQLGIWDARAATKAEETAADDDDAMDVDTAESGRYWRLQMHWPATSKSSISCIKFDPVDMHSVYTSSYDCTIRRLSFTSGISEELYAMEDTLISAFDFTKDGRTIWISDTRGGITHLDLRGPKTDATRYQLSEKHKIGGVSLNPSNDWSLLSSSNDRWLKLWDTRQLRKIPGVRPDSDGSTAFVDPVDVDYHSVSQWMKSSDTGRSATMRGGWSHGFSVSSAYWDASGRRIISTSYDDKLRVWDIPHKYLLADEPLKTFKPKVELKHDCQTGRWLTIFKAMWRDNADLYPHFSVGSMDHSLKIFAADGDVLANLSDKDKITAVQAVTALHPQVVGRAATGNASGRCVLWSSN